MVDLDDRALIAGRYRLGPALGAGAFGEVRSGWDTRLDRPVAIKLLRAGRAESGDAIRRFRREARVTARLRSPHAVPIHDVGRLDDGRLYMVMQRVEGRTLGAAIAAEGPLPVERALARIDQLCALLAEAHDAGLVHRDLKPSNIMLDEVAGHGERVRVLDFGMAKVAEAGHDSTRSVVGTAAYIAPEIWREEAIDGRADLYAVGLLLYEMLAGAPAVVARTVHGAARAHLFDAITPLAERAPPVVVPPDVDALLTALLAREPERRPADAATVRARIAAITGRPVVVTDPPRPAADRRGEAPGASGAFDGRAQTLSGTDSLDGGAPVAAPDAPPEAPGPIEGSAPATAGHGPRRGRWLWALLAAAATAAFVAQVGWLEHPARASDGVDTGSKAPAQGAMPSPRPDVTSPTPDDSAGAIVPSDAHDSSDDMGAMGAIDDMTAPGAPDATVEGNIPGPAPAATARPTAPAAPNPVRLPAARSLTPRAVSVTSTPVGARVWLGERLVGRTPVDVPLTGAAAVVVDAPAHYARRLVLEPGAEPVHVELEAVVRLE